MLTFYFAIQEQHGLSKTALEAHPLKLLEYLREILGEDGFLVLEAAIKNEIKQTFGIDANVQTLDFDEIAKQAQRKFLDFQELTED